MEISQNVIIVLGVLISVLIGFVAGRYSARSKTDGIIIIDEADEQGHAGMNLQFDISYDVLLKRKQMIFTVENHLKPIQEESKGRT